MNILVTGITGFIPSHLAEHLSQNSDNKIFGLTRSIRYESTFIALNFIDRDNISVDFGDVNHYHDIEEMIAKHDIDVIYHLAAQPIVSIASKSPVSTYNTNINGTINVLEAMRIMSEQMNKEIPTLVMSSDKAYNLNNSLPYKEDDQSLNSSDIYSSSKAAEDLISRAYSYTYNLPIVVARPSNTYGEFDFHWSRLIPSLAKSCFDIKEKDKPLILNKGSYHYIRSYMYVKDTVSALESLVENIDKTRGEAYNISPDNKYTTEEVVNTFLQFADVNKKIEFKQKDITFKEFEQQYLDNTKLYNAIKWTPKYNLESGLKRTIEGYKKWFCESNECESSESNECESNECESNECESNESNVEFSGVGIS